MPTLSPAPSPHEKSPRSREVLPHSRHAAALLILFGVFSMFVGQPNQLVHLPVASLGFPFSLYLLAARAPSHKQAFLRCWLLGLGANAAALYWLVHPMHTVAGLGYEAAVPAMLLACAYLACYPALAGLGVRGLRRLFRLPLPGETPPGSTAGRSFALRLLPSSLLAGCAFAGFEVLCGTLFTGFPWLGLSTAFALTPAWVQAASLFGAYGLSAYLAFCASLGAGALLASSRPERVMALFLAHLLAAALPVYGNARLADPLPASAPLRILMVQGNIDQNQKWLPEFQEATLEHYLRLSREGMETARSSPATRATTAPDLILWPETAMPFYYQSNPGFAGRLRRFAATHNTGLAFGTLGAETAVRDGEALSLLRNRLYLLSPHGHTAALYDKQHLVPFGEYLPFASLLPFLRALLQGLDFSPGTASGPLPLTRPMQRPDPLADAPRPEDAGVATPFSPSGKDAANAVPFGVLICYEAIFPDLAQRQVEQGAQLLVNVSNDGWFGDSSAPLQHLSLSVMRAVEQARPLARATNTGYSASVDARGRITGMTSRLFTEDTLLASLSPSTEITPYHRLHPLPEISLVLLALFSFLGYRLRKRCYFPSGLGDTGSVFVARQTKNRKFPWVPFHFALHDRKVHVPIDRTEIPLRLPARTLSFVTGAALTWKALSVELRR